jgi:hypothetical protein
LDAEVNREAPDKIRTFDFKATRTRERHIERDIVQKSFDGDNFRVVFSAFELPDPCCEEPGADDMIEQIGFAFLVSVFDRLGDN